MVLPPEIWEIVFNYLDHVRDFRSLAEVSKMFNEIITPSFWASPHFIKRLTPDALLHLKHLPIKCINLEEIWTGTTDAWLEIVWHFPKLNKLNINNTISGEQVSDAGIARLVNLTKLASLNLTWNKKISAEGLFEISHLPIVDLSMMNCRIRDTHLVVISKMPMLCKLDVSWSRMISAAGLEYLSELPLQEFCVSACKLNNSSLHQIAKIRTLVKLDLSWNEFTAEGLPQLHKLNLLRHLDLSHNQLELIAMTYIAKLSLSELILRNCGISNHHIKLIGSMKSLHKLDLSLNTDMTFTGLVPLGNLNINKLVLNDCNFKVGKEGFKSTMEHYTSNIIAQVIVL